MSSCGAGLHHAIRTVRMRPKHEAFKQTRCDRIAHPPAPAISLEKITLGCGETAENGKSFTAAGGQRLSGQRIVRMRETSPRMIVREAGVWQVQGDSIDRSVGRFASSALAWPAFSCWSPPPRFPLLPAFRQRPFAAVRKRREARRPTLPTRKTGCLLPARRPRRAGPASWSRPSAFPVFSRRPGSCPLRLAYAKSRRAARGWPVRGRRRHGMPPEGCAAFPVARSPFRCRCAG